MQTLSDTRLEWPGEGPLFESNSNKRWGANTALLLESPPRPLLKSGLQPLDRYGTNQETISMRHEHLTQDWNGLGRVHYSSSICINAGAKMWALFESPLGHYVCQPVALGQVRHQCKSLSYVAEYV